MHFCELQKKMFTFQKDFVHFLNATGKFYEVAAIRLRVEEAAIRLRVEVTLEDAEAHSGLIVGLVCILLGVLVPGLGGVGIVTEFLHRRRPGPLCDYCLKFRVGPAAGRVQVALERNWLD